MSTTAPLATRPKAWRIPWPCRYGATAPWYCVRRGFRWKTMMARRWSPTRHLALAQNTHAAPPVFVFVHLFDLHLPYGLPASVAEKQGISRYDAELEYVDQVLGAFRLLAGGKNGWLAQFPGGGVWRPRRGFGRSSAKPITATTFTIHATRTAARPLARGRPISATR